MNWEQEYHHYILAEGLEDTETLKAIFLYAWVMGKKRASQEMTNALLSAAPEPQ
jgi:hypothetical protein